MNVLIEDYLKNHPKLVPGILKSVHISPAHPEYEDYRQEILLALLGRAEHCVSYEELDKIAFTYGRCRLLDYLRKENRLHQHETFLPETYEEGRLEDYLFESLDFYHCLTETEREICGALQLTSNKKEAAALLKISRGHFYRHLGVIKEKAEKYYQI